MLKRIIALSLAIASAVTLLKGEDPVTMRVKTAQGSVSEFAIDNIEEVEFTADEAIPVRALLYGKKIGYNGDSLFAGIISGDSSNGGGPAEIISRLTGCTYENRAHGGATIARTYDGRHNIVSDINNMAEDLDLICIDGGVNDFWLDVPVGEISPAGDFSGVLNVSTYIGALESIFRKAMMRWPGKPIVFIIPHKVSGAYGSSKNDVAYSLFTDGAREVCRKYGIPYIDGKAVFNINGSFNLHRNLYFLDHDGVHPNEEGYRRYWVGPMISLFASLLL